VIGIVASRLVDEYHRPAIVISLQGDKAMGSCRSIEGFDICRALQECSGHLVTFGGHAMAAGLTTEPDKVEALREAFNEYAQEHLSKEDMAQKLEIDAEVRLDELDVKTVEMIQRLGPFGQGNPQVQLVARNLRLMGQPRVIGKKNDHLQLTVAAADDAEAHMRAGGVMRAVAFGKAKWAKKLIDTESFDLVFEPVINRFNGNVTVEMMVRDMKAEADRR